MKPLHLLNLNLFCFSMRYNAFNLFSYGKLPKQKRPPREPSNKMNKKNTSTTYVYVIFFFFFLYLFTWLPPWQVEVPRPGTEPTPQLTPEPLQ